MNQTIPLILGISMLLLFGGIFLFWNVENYSMPQFSPGWVVFVCASFIIIVGLIKTKYQRETNIQQRIIATNHECREHKRNSNLSYDSNSQTLIKCCHHCGTRIFDEDILFCPNCGTHI